MCEADAVADDWVSKGFHLKIDGIELSLRPAQEGRVVFRTFFSSTAAVAGEEAIRIALAKCLAEPLIRKRWIATIGRAMTHLMGVQGDLREKARGTLAELHFLRVALERFEQ